MNPSTTSGPQVALKHVIGLCGWDFSTLTAEKKRMLSTHIAGFTTDVGFMAYNVAIFDPASRAAHFPGGILPEPARPVLPQQPTAAQCAVHKEFTKVFEAYRNSH